MFRTNIKNVYKLINNDLSNKVYTTLPRNLSITTKKYAEAISIQEVQFNLIIYRT